MIHHSIISCKRCGAIRSTIYFYETLQQNLCNLKLNLTAESQSGFGSLKMAPD